MAQHNETEEKIEKRLQATNNSLKSLEKKIDKEISFKRNLLMSIVKGVGYALGAGIIAAILIAVLSWGARSTKDIPLLNVFFNNAAVQTVIGEGESSKK